MNDIKVSIIVPVYNAGTYLRKCLDTLINQTLKEIEIIIVLDCPTDGSEKIAEEYKTRDERVILIKNKKNLHIGNSRNEGIKIAKGKYIGFSDHDDFSSLNMYEVLYNKAEKENLDLVCSPYIKIINNHQIKLKHYPEIAPEQLPSIILNYAIGISSNTDEYKPLFSYSVIWNKLFKSEIIKKNNIQFIDTQKYNSEDVAFLMEFAIYCKRASITNEDLYFHAIHENNTGASISYRSYEKTIAFIRYMYTFLIQHSLIENNLIRKRFNNSVELYSMMSLQAEFKNSRSILHIWGIINKMKKESIIQRAFKETPLCVFSHPTKSKIFFFKILRLLITF